MLIEQRKKWIINYLSYGQTIYKIRLIHPQNDMSEQFKSKINNEGNSTLLRPLTIWRDKVWLLPLKMA